MTDRRPLGPSDSRPPTDLRRHRQKTERNLVIAGFAVLFVVGGGVIWYQYGLGPAITSWACLGGGVALFGVLYLILKLAEVWVARRRE